MIKIIFVRHGRTLWNSTGRYQGQSDIELSEEGICQAKKLAQNFPVDNIDVVYSSPLKRAYNTGKLIADKFKVPIFADDRFREINFGDWEGLTYDQISAKWGNKLDYMFEHPDIAEIPNGESFVQVQKRAIEGVKEILQSNEGKTVVITAHGGVLRTILAHYLYMPLRYIWSLRQDNTAVNIITYYENNKHNVELINSTAHLSITQLPKLGRFS